VLCVISVITPETKSIGEFMKVLALVSVLVSLSSFADNTDSVKKDQSLRIDKSYQDLNELAGIRCKYIGTGTYHALKRFESKVVTGESITTDYSVDDTPFSIVVSPNDDDGAASFNFEDASIPARVSNDRYGRFYRWVTNNIKINFSKLNESQNDISKKYDLSRLKCEVEVAVASIHEITDSNMHINVHPHKNYDVRGGSNAKVQEYLDTYIGQQLVLLDDKDKKGDGYDVNDFFSDGFADLTRKYFFDPEVLISEDIPMLISPAGHNEYIVTNKNQNVVFTGGNHNYCMWNNTRHIIDAALISDMNESIVFTYDTSGIVVQRGGIINGLAIPKSVFNKSNLLENIFNNFTTQNRNKYLQSYFDYFTNEFLTKKKGMYSKVTFIQEGLLPQTKEVIGSGNREFTVKFNYKHKEATVENK
jgi:hypothetical protein